MNDARVFGDKGGTVRFQFVREGRDCRCSLSLVYRHFQDLMKDQHLEY